MARHIDPQSWGMSAALRIHPTRLRRGDSGSTYGMLGSMSLLGLFVIGAGCVLSLGSVFFVPVVAAIVLGLMLGPFAGRMERIGLPPFLVALLLLLMLIGLAYAVFVAFAAPIDVWIARSPEIWRALTDKLRIIREPLEDINRLANTVKEVATPEGTAPEVQVQGPSFLMNVLIFAPPAMAQLVLFIGTLFFYLATRTALRRSAIGACMRRRTRIRMARIFRDAEDNISRYLATITLINIGLGVATGLVMWLIGVPAPALWGLLAALLNYAPYVGPLCIVVILTGVGLVSFDTLGMSLLPPLAYIALNVTEGQFVTPSIVGRRLTLNPLAVFLSLGFWLWLWGPIGAFIAVPILIILMVSLIHATPFDLAPNAAPVVQSARPVQPEASVDRRALPSSRQPVVDM